MATKTYRSKIAATVHETMEGFHQAGLADKETMRHFDETCLTEVHEFTPEDIRELRLREEVSQSVLARYLNVSKGIISQWERGEKKPGGAALKLLSLIQHNGINAIAWLQSPWN